MLLGYANVLRELAVILQHIYFVMALLSSRKHGYIILTPLNPVFI